MADSRPLTPEVADELPAGPRAPRPDQLMRTVWSSQAEAIKGINAWAFKHAFKLRVRTKVRCGIGPGKDAPCQVRLECHRAKQRGGGKPRRPGAIPRKKRTKDCQCPMLVVLIANKDALRESGEEQWALQPELCNWEHNHDLPEEDKNASACEVQTAEVDELPDTQLQEVLDVLSVDLTVAEAEDPDPVLAAENSPERCSDWEADTKAEREEAISRFRCLANDPNTPTWFLEYLAAELSEADWSSAKETTELLKRILGKIPRKLAIPQANMKARAPRPKSHLYYKHHSSQRRDRASCRVSYPWHGYKHGFWQEEHRAPDRRPRGTTPALRGVGAGLRTADATARFARRAPSDR
eukprot:scaffold307_cov390-Prasinococcus_capsulatus_cf.AAC.3